MILFLSLIHFIPKKAKKSTWHNSRFYLMTTSCKGDLPSWNQRGDDHQVDEEVGLRLRPKWVWPRLASRCHGPTWFRKRIWWWSVIMMMISDDIIMMFVAGYLKRRLHTGKFCPKKSNIDDACQRWAQQAQVVWEAPAWWRAAALFQILVPPTMDSCSSSYSMVLLVVKVLICWWYCILMTRRSSDRQSGLVRLIESSQIGLKGDVVQNSVAVLSCLVRSSAFWWKPHETITADGTMEM